MGGLAVHKNHESNIKNLYGVGECASMYHGANRLGGNSLLAALYSGMVAADSISEKRALDEKRNFREYISKEQEKLRNLIESDSFFAAMHIRDMLAGTMREHMSIVRNEESLLHGIDDVDYYLSIAGRINYDASVSVYTNYSLEGILTLGRAALTCAQARKESRGAHYRSDYPQTLTEYEFATLISYDDGEYKVTLDREHTYED
jgi:succinate dehydrogenase / fumarate reductase flavoprotein subunit